MIIVIVLLVINENSNNNNNNDKTSNMNNNIKIMLVWSCIIAFPKSGFSLSVSGQTSGSHLDAKPPPSGRHEAAHGNSVCARVTHHVLVVDAFKFLPQVAGFLLTDLIYVTIIRKPY